MRCEDAFGVGWEKLPFQTQAYMAIMLAFYIWELEDQKTAVSRKLAEKEI